MLQTIIFINNNYRYKSYNSVFKIFNFPIKMFYITEGTFLYAKLS